MVYQNAATSFKTKSCGISAKKCAPNLRQNLHRKRVSVPPVKPQSLRKRHTADMAAEINAKLAKGWNPFLAVMWTKPVGDIIYKILIEG